MTDLKPRRVDLHANPVKFALILLCLVLLTMAAAPLLGRVACDVVDKQIAVWDAERAAFESTLVAN